MMCIHSISVHALPSSMITGLILGLPYLLPYLEYASRGCHSLGMNAAEALARLRTCAVLPEPSLLAYEMLVPKSHAMTH